MPAIEGESTFGTLPSGTTEGLEVYYVPGPVGPQGPTGEPGEGVVWRGAYSGVTAYEVYDAVSYLGQSYICIVASTGNLPTDITYWDVLLGSSATAEDTTNKKTTMTGNTTSDIFYLTAKAVYDWATGLFVQKNSTITGATKTKITYDAKGLVTSGDDATTADIADSSNKRYVTDAQQTVIGNTSGTNSGDQTATTVPVTPAGNLVATNVQAGLTELQTDIDTINTALGNLSDAVVLKGSWNAAGGSFPGSGVAQAGWTYIVSNAGTVDGIAFNVNDRLLAIVDNASATTFANNWFKLDYTDQVLSVAGKTGAVTLDMADLSETATLKIFTDTERSKLSGIEALADVTDAGNVGPAIHGSTPKTTPADADTFAAIDSAASNVLTKVSWLNIRATLKTYFDGLYPSGSGTSSGTNTGDVTLAGSPNYITIVGQVITRALINLTSHVTGTLPVANGGTGTTSSTGTGSVVLSNSPALVTPTGIVKGDVGLGNVDNTSDVNKPVSTAQATADTAALNAAKAYADGLVTGLLDYRGGYDASPNTFPTSGGSGSAGAVVKGDMWVISVAGTLGGTAVQIGDSLIANIDTPGQTAANWNILNSNISYVSEDVANKATTMTGNTASNTIYLSAKAIYDWITTLLLASLTGKTTPVDADGVPIMDSAASNVMKFLSFTNLKVFLKTYFDGLYVDLTTTQAVGGSKRFLNGTLAMYNAATTNFSSFTNANTGSRTYTLQDSSDTIVMRDTTDTLTNKTLTTPTITKPVMSATNPSAQTYTPSAAGTATLDLSLSNQHDITMPAGNITIALSNATNNQIFAVSVTQDGTGSRTVTWFATIRWAGGSTPTLTTTANKRDLFGFKRTGSNTYDGFIIGQNI